MLPVDIDKPTLTLSNANTYTGPTNVNGGVLNVTGSLGNGGVTVLTNGNFVVRSSLWDNVAATNAGASDERVPRGGRGALAHS